MTYVSSVTQKGLVLIPVSFRNRHGFLPLSPVVIEDKDEGVLIKPALTTKQMQGFIKTTEHLTDKQLEKEISSYDYS